MNNSKSAVLLIQKKSQHPPLNTWFTAVQFYHLADVYTPWAIKKRAPLIFSITMANIDGFS